MLMIRMARFGAKKKPTYRVVVIDKERARNSRSVEVVGWYNPVSKPKGIKLDHERIVRPIPAAPGQDPMRFRRYEIFHDVLAPTINRAIAAREEQRRVRRIRRSRHGGRWRFRLWIASPGGGRERR